MDEAKSGLNRKPTDDHEDDGFDDLEGVKSRRSPPRTADSPDSPGGGGTVQISGGGGIEAAYWRALDQLPSHHENPFKDDAPKPSRFKKRIAKARLHDDHHEFRKLPDTGQDLQLARWLYLAYDRLWPLAVEAKWQFDRDPERARLEMGFTPRSLPWFFMTTAELQRWYTVQKQSDPELAELPRDVADQILDNVVEAYIEYQKTYGAKREKLDNPVKTLRFRYVHFITRDVDYDRDKSLRKYINTAGDGDDLQVNDRVVRIPKLGNVSFTANEASRMFLRTANLRIMSAVIRLHDDGEWRIRPHFKRLRGRLIHKNVIINEILQQFPEQEVEQWISKAGYHLRKHELNKQKRDFKLHPLAIIEQVAKLVNCRPGDPATWYVSSTDILVGLQSRGITISAKYLQHCLGTYNIEKHRGRINGGKPTSYYITAGIEAVHRREGVPDHVQ